MPLTESRLKKILIFGNSGSGKTTLAKQMADEHQLAHLDLDTIAWQATTPPQRESLAKSKALIDSYCDIHKAWVIEGCYADLLNLACHRANQLIFMDVSIAQCVKNAKNRPWEAHKYASKEAQDKNLDMLIAWIEGYETRDDGFSRRAHQSLYDHFGGTKTLISTQRELS